MGSSNFLGVCSEKRQQKPLRKMTRRSRETANAAKSAKDSAKDAAKTTAAKAKNRASLNKGSSPSKGDMTYDTNFGGGTDSV